MIAFKILRNKAYLAIAALSSAVLTIVYIYSQVLGNLDNADIWFSIIPLYNAVLFGIFAVLFGVSFAFQIYRWKQPKACNAKGGAGATGTATFISFLVAQCPACASLGALLLPVSVFQTLVLYSPLINIISIIILLFAIHYLGGFKEERA